MTLQLTYCDIVANVYNLLPVQKQEAKIAQYHENMWKIVYFFKSEVQIFIN